MISLYPLEYICNDFKINVELVGTFDPDNPFHPCKAVLDALRVEGVTIIDPGSKPDADDVTIKGRLRYLADLCDSACDTCCNKHCVALVANDSDFAPEVKNGFFLQKSHVLFSSHFRFFYRIASGRSANSSAGKSRSHVSRSSTDLIAPFFSYSLLYFSVRQ